MRGERDYEQVKFQNLTPAEQTAYVSFGCIANREFDRLSQILSPEIVLIDANFNLTSVDPEKGPEPIQGKDAVLQALNEAFGSGGGIEFNIAKIGGMTRSQSDMEQGITTVAVETITSNWREGLSKAVKPDNKVGQAFFIDIRDINGVPMITRVEAYQQYPLPTGE